MGGDAGDDRGGDQEGAEGEGGALGGEAEGQKKDWVSTGVIKGEIAFEGAGSSWPWAGSGDGV